MEARLSCPAPLRPWQSASTVRARCRRRVGGGAAAVLIAVGLVVACDTGPRSAAVPAPAELTGEEIGYYCNMIVATHLGPKGQVFLSDRIEPLWFASARDTLAFTLLPGEPKNVSAVYVSDMGRASWDHPEPGTWVEAKTAWYVVGSGRAGGMGAPELAPFSSRAAANAFRARYGGRVLGFKDISSDDVLGFEAAGAGRPGMSHADHEM